MYSKYRHGNRHIPFYRGESPHIVHLSLYTYKGCYDVVDWNQQSYLKKKVRGEREREGERERKQEKKKREKMREEGERENVWEMSSHILLVAERERRKVLM